MKHTVQTANFLLYFLKKTISAECTLIGSLSQGKDSDHDIDILIPNLKNTVKLKNKLMKLLSAKSFEYTDWGGIYFHQTFFGEIDVFFEHPHKNPMSDYYVPN